MDNSDRKRRISQSCDVVKKAKPSLTKDLVPKSCKLYRPQNGKVVPEVIGCSDLADLMRRYIGEPLAQPQNYEIEAGGRGVVSRFLHLNGCKRNSGTTYLRYFCNANNINLFMLHKQELFNDMEDFAQVFHLAKRMQPALIYINNFDNHLVVKPENSDAISVLSRECGRVSANNYSVWVLLRTNIVNFEAQNPLHWDFYEYFGSSYVPLPLQTDADVALILQERLAYYLPDAHFNPVEVVAFANAYARHCTYFQINDFVRKVIKDAHDQLPDNARLASPYPVLTLASFSRAINVVELPSKNTLTAILPFVPLYNNYQRYRKP